MKIGDIVRLKSGGPATTIVDLAKEVKVAWYDGSEAFYAWFPGEALEHVNATLKVTDDIKKELRRCADRLRGIPLRS